MKTRTIPFLDMRAQYLELKEELDEAYAGVMNSGWYILGEEVIAFEQEFARYLGAKHCVGVGNGLEALQLILMALGIGREDEVIVPANAYIASWLAVSYVGATPIPVEPDPFTYNLDPAPIEKAITARTKAIVPVHLYGQPSAMGEICRIARQHGLMVVEDSAQTHGAKHLGRFAGTFGSASGFSFYPTKNLGAFGDAGAVVTDNDQLADNVRVLRNYGSRKRYYNETKGHNSRLDPLQSAFLRVKLKRLDGWNERRNEIARYYLEQLTGLDELALPKTATDSTHVWHQFVIAHPRRNELQKHLEQQGIGTLIHYPVPPHLSDAYSELGYQRGDFPITERMADSVLSIPIGPHLDLDDAGYVAESIRKFCRS
jgi:dTDP-4-amino-4,6-dideoxygalactose transaminase